MESFVSRYSITNWFQLRNQKANNVAVGWGFVEHPVMAPELSTLGVWHQLHCLVSFPLVFDFVLTFALQH